MHVFQLFIKWLTAIASVALAIGCLYMASWAITPLFGEQQTGKDIMYLILALLFVLLAAITIKSILRKRT